MRMSARMEGDFVVFLIGMRINRLRSLRKWLPVAKAMPPMIKELRSNPAHGLLGFESFFNGRTTLMVQYWRSTDHLMAYAKDREASHWPAWKRFFREVYTSEAVGVWHETYTVSGYESVYVNMPEFGLGKAGELVPTTSVGDRGAERLAAVKGSR
ncbi:DUF4188 domain-containing protein [Microtetraspora sp. NBRC 16547]|uniref:DUF4188 domain-containing protein n=1 Tax=Microtetraspora sp. NBRC 16547 TaxID=3030993 RepID=UPI00249FC03A|nr:DUF4188 domain-containing protein [Microtetraspora sp. NBRC 16547]GLW98073.1 transcriptional regulator [Microtetraspora sp. NBRC 16547]